MLGTPTSQVSVISKEGSLNAPFLFKNFKTDYTHRRLRLAFFLFALKIDSLTSTNSFIKRFVKNKNSAINH